MAMTPKSYRLLLQPKEKGDKARTISSRIFRIILSSIKTVLSGIGMPKNKYAFLNIVYFGLAYIWLTDQTKPNLRLLSSLCFLKTHSQKRRQCDCVFSLFAAILLTILYDFMESSNSIRWSYRGLSRAETRTLEGVKRETVGLFEA